MKIDIQMECDPTTGQRFSVFDPSIPYLMWAGVWIDKDGQRYCPNRGIRIFEHLQFVEMVPRLSEYLREGAEALEQYSARDVIEQSKPFKIG